ncbi:MAG: MFS transporter [Novosphingobium sp.]
MPDRFVSLAGTELWERFALHGVKSLLTLYLVQHVLIERAPAVWGLSLFRSWLESIWGPLSPSAFASQTYGLYAALTYFVLPFGGAAGDSRLGRSRAVILGAFLIAAGGFCLAWEWLLLPALAILILGTGLLKANLAAQVGELFPAHDTRRSEAFAVYLAFLNIGVMLGPLVCGWLAQSRGWAYAFGAAGLAMMLGLVTYLRVPGVTGMETGSARPEAASPAALPGRPSLAIDLFLVWIAGNVQLDIGGFHIPPAWFASADGVFTIAMVLATTRLRLFARLRDGDRLALGCLALICGYGGLAAATRLGLSSLMVPLAVLAMLDLGIALVWPAGIAIVTATAPKGVAGVMVGLFYLHGFFANLVVGTVGVFYDRMAIPAFWGLHAAIAGLGLALALLVRAPVNRTGQAG